MIEVRAGKRGRLCEIRITGHAEYSHAGEDIVCAAVSALAYTLLGALISAKADVEYSDKPGDFIARFSCGFKARVILNTIIVGLLQIEASYPENLKVHKASRLNGT